MTNPEDLISSKNGTVSVTVHKNHLKDGEFSYAKVVRDTADEGNIIADILEHDKTFSKGQLLHFSIAYRESALRLYAKGFAVSLLNLGTVYHYAPTSSGEKDEAGNPIIKRFGVGFTPSDILKEANDSVELKEMKKEETNPEILSITDRSTGLSDFTLHIGKPVHIKGNRLKLAGENCGVRFAKVSEDGSYTLDGALLIKVEKVYVNEPKSLEFLIPDGFSEGKYRIVISTASGRGSSVNKTMRHYMSDEITLMA